MNSKLIMKYKLIMNYSPHQGCGMAIVSWECACEGDVDGFVFSNSRCRMDLPPHCEVCHHLTFSAVGLRLTGEPSARHFALLLGCGPSARARNARVLGPPGSPCSEKREPLNLHNSGYRATTERRIGCLDVKCRAPSF